jgi:hypothetical protein
MGYDIPSWERALAKMAHAVNEYGCPASWLALPKRVRDRAVLSVMRGSDPVAVMEMYCAA